MLEKEINNFVDNEWCQPHEKKYLDNFNPSTGLVQNRIADSDVVDVERAVQAAKKAFNTWSETSIEERYHWLCKLADSIEKNIDEFALLESLDQGKPLTLAREMDMRRSISNFRFFAGAIRQTREESVSGERGSLNYVIRQPVGVAGLISPWNLPLYLLTWKMAPALACGNTVVCKPSELTSLTAARLAKTVQEIGLPRGVVNFVFGTGPKAGESLVRHPDVPLISFTGGTATGQRIFAQASEHLKRLSLELGGKNPNIVFADCDYENMLETTLRSSFLNQGEICLCGSRIYVEDSLYDRFVEDFVGRTKKLKVGDPRSADTFMGPLVSESHRNKVLSYIELAKKDAGTIIAGGDSPKIKGFEGGYFVSPTVILGLDESSRCVQEEIFGPVVTISRFKTTDEVLAKANAVRYGLSATVWTENLSRAHLLAKRLHAGTVWINTWMHRDLRVPFGGMKASGIGREGGTHSLDFFSETKTICLKFGEGK